MDLSAEQVASLSDEHSPLTPRITSTTQSVSTTTAASSKSRKTSPPNFVKILSKQKKGITYELILEVSYYIRTTDGYVLKREIPLKKKLKIYGNSWLERFIEDGGMQIIAKELGTIHKKQNRYVCESVFLSLHQTETFF